MHFYVASLYEFIRETIFMNRSSNYSAKGFIHGFLSFFQNNFRNILQQLATSLCEVAFYLASLDWFEGSTAVGGLDYSMATFCSGYV